MNYANCQTAFHASWSNSVIADQYTLKVSRGTSVVSTGNYFLDRLASLITSGSFARLHSLHHLPAQVSFVPLRQYPPESHR